MIEKKNLNGENLDAVTGGVMPDLYGPGETTYRCRTCGGTFRAAVIPAKCQCSDTCSGTKFDIVMEVSRINGAKDST